MRAWLVVTLFLLSLFPLATGASPAATLNPDEVNNAQWRQASKPGRAESEPLLIKAQVLLDRAHFSPGEIDGRQGENYKKALMAFAADRGLQTDGRLTEEVWRALAGASSDPVLQEYTLTEKDLEGPFLRRVPARLEKMKGLSRLAYGSARESIAERFHMSQGLLAKLNPRQKFERAGDKIVVVRIGDEKPAAKAARLEIDKTAQTMKAFDESQKLIAFFPITVGSTEKPAPSGELKIRNIFRNPTYRYNPAYAFRGVRARRPFKVAPGPNNPVGLVWIALPGEGYGIHGTPEPGRIGKTASHGCVRLTNWDALRLADLVSKGTPVSFLGEETPRRVARRRG